MSTIETPNVKISTDLSHSSVIHYRLLHYRYSYYWQANSCFFKTRFVVFPGDWILTFFVLCLLERSLGFLVYASCEYFYKLLFYNISSHTFNSKWISLLNEKPCESMLWKRLYFTTAFSYLNETFDHFFFSRDLGANLLGEAISGLLDGLIQLEVLWVLKVALLMFLISLKFKKYIRLKTS